MRLLAVCSLALGLVACAPFVEQVDIKTASAAETNAALQVRIFPIGSQAPQVKQYIGPVNAYSCKNKVWDKPASTGDAVAQLRLKALRMGANAVIDMSTDTRGTDTFGTNCWESVQAQGTAVVLQ
jgi:uncharacterized protein YbjQ (UPF0145 family)